MSARLAVLLAGVLALAALAAGCGSSDDSTDETSADVEAVTITKPQLIEQGDAICKQGDEEIEDGFTAYFDRNDIPKGQEPNEAQSIEIVETVILPNIKTQAEMIRGLGAPEGDEEEVETMLDELDQAVADGEANPELLFEDDSDPFGDANQRAEDYGFEVCGQG